MPIITPIINYVDPFSVLYNWYMMKGGDEGAPIEAWAFPHLCFHMTGNSDRHSVDVMGSNDSSCYGVLATLETPQDWVNDHLHDCVFKADDLPRVRFLKVIVRGPGEVPDCSVILFATRPFGHRID